MVTGFELIFEVDVVARSVAWFEHASFNRFFHDDTYVFARRARASPFTWPKPQQTNYRSRCSLHPPPKRQPGCLGSGAELLFTLAGTFGPVGGGATVQVVRRRTLRRGNRRGPKWTDCDPRTMASERPPSPTPTANVIRFGGPTR